MVVNPLSGFFMGEERVNLSSNKKRIVKTADGVPIEEGLRVYLPNVLDGSISYFDVVHWHNGKNTLLYWPDGARRQRRYNCSINIEGHGGAGIYPNRDEEGFNCYQFILAGDCYAEPENAMKRIYNYANREMKRYRKLMAESMDVEPTELKN